MGSIIDDLLNLAKIGIQEINKTNFSLTELTNQLILNFQLNSDIKKFTFVINDLGTIHADKSLVIYALNNLLSNAIKYSSKHENPVIEIGKIIHEELPTYYVKDNGVGFNKENAKRMFKPFQRFHHESDFEGNGIGLSIVRIIIEKHGGNIWAESEENKGAEFYFNFKNN
jgi:light-regulated signal transduction histidine kinase (bacteriophytochrome)